MTTYRETDSDDLDSALGTLSMRDKSLLKRSINKHHNNNIGAGYVPVHEEALHKTGLRGRKTYAFWTLVGLLSLLAWANMVITIVIFQVLRLGHGPESLELIPQESIVKFFGSSDLGDVYKPDGKVEGFADEPMDIKSEKGSLSFEVSDPKTASKNSIYLGYNGSSVSGVQLFEIKHPASNEKIFSTETPTFRLPKGVRKLDAKITKSQRITSSIDEKLVLRSDSVTKLRGIEGTKIEGKEIVWSADQVVTLRSMNGSIVLGGGRGISLNVKSIPIVGSDAQTGLPLSAQYKVCVCMPQGKLFRVPVSTDYSSQIACHNIDQSHINNPCM